MKNLKSGNRYSGEKRIWVYLLPLGIVLGVVGSLLDRIVKDLMMPFGLIISGIGIALVVISVIFIRGSFDKHVGSTESYVDGEQVTTNYYVRDKELSKDFANVKTKIFKWGLRLIVLGIWVVIWTTIFDAL